MIDKKNTVFIFDTSAIFSGKEINFYDYEIITTDGVSEEIKPGGKDFQKFEMLKEIGLKILSPSKNSIEEIKKISKKTGDIERLSKTDIEILAVALDLKNKNKDPIILSDDYSIQNISDNLDIKYENISQNKITKRFTWISKCMGCKKKYKEHINICPICGTKTKKIIKNEFDIKK